MTGEENIKGKDWNTEVGRVGTDPEILKRQERFYKARAQLKLGIPDLEQVLNDPDIYGLSTYSHVEKFDGAHKEIPLEGKFEVGSEEALSEILTKYFRQNLEETITDKKKLERRVAKEVYLTLYYLTQQKDANGEKISADLVNRGETVEIVNGKLYIFTTPAAGKEARQVRINGVYLRKPKPGDIVAAKPAQELAHVANAVALTRVDAAASKVDNLIANVRTFEEQGMQDFEATLRAANTITRSTSGTTREEKFAAVDGVFKKAETLRGEIKRLEEQGNALVARLKEEQGKLDFYELSEADQETYRGKVEALESEISGLGLAHESLGQQMKQANNRWKEILEFHESTGDEEKLLLLRKDPKDEVSDS